MDIGQVPLLPFYEPRRNRSQQIKTHKRNRPVWRNLDRSSLVHKGFITWPKRKPFLIGPSLQTPSSASKMGSQSEHRICFILPQKIQILFARMRFPAVSATRIDSLCDWLINLHHFLNQSEGNSNEWWHTSTCFAALETSYSQCLDIC